MVAARSAAMGFNRLVDARYRRAQPADGDARAAARRDDRRARPSVFVVARRSCSSPRRAARPLCFALSPVALAIVFWYSLAKRFTSYTQLFLGLAMAVAPVGGWLAAGGAAAGSRGCSALAIGTWVGGFDVLYACQDLEFDRAHGLRSIPVRFGVARRCVISRPCTSSPSSPALARSRRRAARLDLLAGVAGVAVLLRLRAVAGQRARSVAGQARVRSERLRRHPLPRGDGASPSMSADAKRSVVAIAITGASGAIYATRTLAALLERGCHVELIVSDYGRRLLRDELGDAAAVDQLHRLPRARATATASRAGAHAAQQQGPRRDDRQRQPGLRGDGDRAVLDEDAGRRRARPVAQPDRARRRRHAQGAAPLIIVPRETPMSLPQLRNMVLCAEAGAMMMPAMPAFYQMPKTLDDLADFMAGKILARSASSTSSIRVEGGADRPLVPDTADPDNRRDRRDVRRDRAPLRPAQSRAQRRPRSPLARARRGRCALAPARACSTCARAPPIWRSRSRAAGRASVVGVDFAGAMLRLGLAKVRARPGPTDSAGSRRRDAHPAGIARPAMRRPSRSASGTSPSRTRALAEIARVLARRPARDPRVRPAARFRASGRSTPGISATCCRCRPVSCRSTERLLLPAGLGRRLPAPGRVLRDHRGHGFSQSHAVPLTFGIVYLYM